MGFGGRRARKAARAAADLHALLDAASAQALPVEQALWIIELLDWLRGGPDAALLRDGLNLPLDPPAQDPHDAPAPAEIQRLQILLDLLERLPERRAEIAAVVGGLLQHTDATLLLADSGFSQRPSFFSEFSERLGNKWLPKSPETRDLAVLFALFFPDERDAHWLEALDGHTLARLSAVWQPPEVPQAPDSASLWRTALLDALTYTISHIRAAGFSPDLRSRMQHSGPLAGEVETPFKLLAMQYEAVQTLLTQQASRNDEALRQSLTLLRAGLQACRQQADSVTAHLEDHGTSVSLVYALHQLHQRIDRAEALLNCLVGDTPARDTAHLFANLVRLNAQRRSLRALWRHNTALLAEKMAERHAESGEHYITRDRREYRAMLGAAMGGGLIMGFTTWIKIGILGLKTALFWTGLLAGLNYAVSFVIVQLLHWTIATKQPAMTAPAMADKLGELSRPGGVERFVDEVANLTRSQSAGVFGNVLLVMPVALLLGLGGLAWFGPQFLPAPKAEHELESLSLLGPTPLFAAFTGVLLFLSSVIAGWAENAFVLHRLDSAIAWNPRIRRCLGAQRAARWSAWWRRNVGVMAGNVSLGLLLGLTPEFFRIFGIDLQVRHVTLSSGLFGAACASLGPAVVDDPAFWWALAGIAVNGVLNVGVSFYLAYRLALRARGIQVKERRAIYASIARRLWRRPWTFILPPRNAAASAQGPA
ncbi:MAG: site-specific recombinase [Thiomonas sp.]|uniref:site-specific recombinase n=1 Tax=Thiomonas sp. TaxID=2047785 RepID=UPI002A364C69|nr:site-specific recombinase [Thiomonas sp.]MDY0331291.1 site-specific recombinase [Thiomonas sp.]